MAAPALGMAWARIGQLVELSGPEPAAPPVGRVMQFQAVDAGERLHRLLTRVPVYRRAMLVAGGSITEEIAALVGPPLLAGVMASGEQAQAALWPLFASMIQTSALAMAKAQREQLAALDSVSEYSEEIAGMMAALAEQLFAPRPGAPVSEQADGDPTATPPAAGADLFGERHHGAA